MHDICSAVHQARFTSDLIKASWLRAFVLRRHDGAAKAGRFRRFGPKPRPDFRGDFHLASR